MLNKEKDVPVDGTIVLLLVLINTVILETAFIQNKKLYMALIITLPLLLVAIYDVLQKRKEHSDDQATASSPQQSMQAISPGEINPDSFLVGTVIGKVAG